MIKMRTIGLLMCLVLLFSLVGGGCAKKEEGKAANNSKTSETKEASGKAADDDSNSPWKLVSETSVETKVNYAGFLNESFGVTVGYAGETSYTSDGGKHWEKSDNVSACRYGLDLLDESFIASSGNSGVNLGSDDKGSTWYHLGDFPLKSGTAFNKFLSIVDSKNMFVGASRALAVSNDRGNTWTELTLPDKSNKIIGMFFLDAKIGFILSSDGILYKTVDCGANWTSQTIDLGGEILANYTMPAAAINFQDEKNGMIILTTKTFKHLCYKTKDGSTWESVEMPKTNGQAPYLSRDGKYLTLSAATKKITLYKLESK
jgi:Uncharacterized protein related to plant photosystem II stability/assembly factor